MAAGNEPEAPQGFRGSRSDEDGEGWGRIDTWIISRNESVCRSLPLHVCNQLFLCQGRHAAGDPGPCPQVLAAPLQRSGVQGSSSGLRTALHSLRVFVSLIPHPTLSPGRLRWRTIMFQMAPLMRLDSLPHLTRGRTVTQPSALTVMVPGGPHSAHTAPQINHSCKWGTRVEPGPPLSQSWDISDLHKVPQRALGQRSGSCPYPWGRRSSDPTRGPRGASAPPGLRTGVGGTWERGVGGRWRRERSDLPGCSPRPSPPFAGSACKGLPQGLSG